MNLFCDVLYLTMDTVCMKLLHNGKMEFETRIGSEKYSWQTY